MKLRVNPTRMELLRLKKRLKTANKGHKLLKEKRDGLMKEFMAVISEAKTTRVEAEKKLHTALTAHTMASASMTPLVLAAASILPSQKIVIDFEERNVMSVKIPVIDFQTEGDFVSYGFSDTSGELDIALKNLQEALPSLIKLAQIEKSAQMLASEIEKTRRRVNALEHVLIPNIIETISYIQMKLSETERAAIAGTMRIKAMITEG